MFSLKKRPKATAEIQLSSITQPWLSNEDIIGCAAFSLPAGIDFSHSKVVLRGATTTKTDEYPDALQRSWRTERQPFVGVTLDSSPKNLGFGADDGLIKIPFRFNLEDIFAQTQSTIISSLPPSVNSKDESSGKWSGTRSNELAGQYDITYSISASVYSRKGLEASTTKSIPILPISQSDPASPDDVPGEFVFATLSPHLAKLPLTKATPFVFSVAAQEPESIVLDAHDSLSYGSTTIPFVVKAKSSSHSELKLASLPKQCRIQARLVSKTLVTPDRIEQRFIPYIDQSRFAKTSSQKVQKSNEQESLHTLPEWNHIAPGSEDQFALANFSFDFHINSNKILPSFFTPILSRRYVIDVTIDFPGSSSPSQKLALPVSIVYEADEFDYVKP